MNRAAWFRLLQVAVVAPYLFHLSRKETGYFGVGLKLVAGSLIAMNLQPLMEDAKVAKEQAQNVLANLAKAQQTLQAQNAGRTVINAEDVAEGEFTSPG